MLGHDLQNPLSAMMMWASHMLARGHLDDDDGRMVLRVMHSGRRMQRMIADILDFTRARMGGGLELSRGPTNMREICGNVADELAVASTSVVSWSADGDVRGFWDADRLTRLLSNVTRNAVEHARANTRVELHAHDDGERVVVTVTNEGEPIASDAMTMLFEPFRRGPHERASSGNLGLGLFIAHEAVLAHGGEISAGCAGGKTTFTITLPRRAPTRPVA